MTLYTSVPINRPDLHDQKELADVTDEEFNSYFEPKKPGILLRVYRFICFIVFLGPIRFVLTLLCFFLYYVGCCILPKFSHLFKNDKEFRQWAQKILYPIARAGLFCVGIVHIKKTGSIKEDTRTIVVNHLTMIDILTVCSHFECAFLSMASLAQVEFFKKAVSVIPLVFVDRSKSQGTTQQIQDIQSDPTMLPLVVFPEGKVTNGGALLGFRTGAFVSETPLQPMTFRYNHWLCPKNMATIAWNEWNTLLYIYQLYSVPFLTLEINVLPQVVFKGSDKTPAEKAAHVELMMANSLGCLALKRTNKDYFQKDKAE